MAKAAKGARTTPTNAVNPDDDWTTVSDPADRRRIQNRLAQRTYRQNLKKRQQELNSNSDDDTGHPYFPSVPHLPHCRRNLDKRSGFAYSSYHYANDNLGLSWCYCPGYEFASDNKTHSFRERSCAHPCYECAKVKEVPGRMNRQSSISSSASSSTSPTRSMSSASMTSTSMDQDWASTALHMAVKSGNEAVVALLIGKGVNVNVVDPDGMTSLHLSAKSGNLSMSRLLLEKGAIVGMKDNFGNDPMYYATGSGCIGLPELLCNMGTL